MHNMHMYHVEGLHVHVIEIDTCTSPSVFTAGFRFLRMQKPKRGFKNRRIVSIYMCSSTDILEFLNGFQKSSFKNHTAVDS